MFGSDIMCLEDSKNFGKNIKKNFYRTGSSAVRQLDGSDSGFHGDRYRVVLVSVDYQQYNHSQCLALFILSHFRCQDLVAAPI